MSQNIDNIQTCKKINLFNKVGKGLCTKARVTQNMQDVYNKYQGSNEAKYTPNKTN